MPGIRETRRLPYSAEQMFDLVADVARYGEFLPWVIATRVRSGIVAYNDRDDVIEFGLLLRAGDASVSLLHATLVLDADDILLNVISEADMDLNFDAKLDESKMDRLQKALDFYAEHVNSYASAETR